MLVEAVALGVVGALVVVDAADELAPADDLAEEPLEAVERDGALGVGLEGGVDHLAWVEQLEV